MEELIQSATNAASQGDKNKAIELIKQALDANPNDVDALLVLASIVVEPTRKRQVLNRILSLEAANKAAREMLLEMDRAEMSAYRSQPISAPVSTAQSQPALSVSQQPVPPPRTLPNPATEKPLVFRYSGLWLVVLYLFTTIFCCEGLLAASQSVASSLPSLILALLFGLTALSASSKVEVKETGIRASSLLGGAEIKWNDIASIKSNPMKRRLELISNKGESVKVSTQVKGYPVIVEILRQKRPDLFGEAASSPVKGNTLTSGYDQFPSTSHGNSVPAAAFTATKTFQKSFFKQYGLYFWVIPVFLLLVWLGLAEPQLRTPSLLSAAFCALVMIFPLFQVNTVKVEPNKLTIETFFEEKEFSAPQIKEIKMQSLRGRYGRVTNIINIIPVEGKKYPLGGFSDGDEIIYGFLMNWWNAYQNR